jgi:hypothetical protein
MTPKAAAAATDVRHTLTSDRDETKYVVDRTGVASLVEGLGRSIAHHEHDGNMRRLPDAHHFSTTVYFDTNARSLYRAARADAGHNFKVRAREYYDLHPSLAELATDPTDVVRYDPVLWFELKERDGTRTAKDRFCLPKAEVPKIFAGGAPSFAGTGVGAELRRLSEFLTELGQPLAASSLVNYRRLSFQDESAALRVTVDIDIAYFAPPADLWTSARALVRSRLGAPRGREARGLVEVKHRAASAPAWLNRALASAGARPLTFSKFEEAERAVHPDD